MTTEMNIKQPKEKILADASQLLSNEFRVWYSNLIGEEVIESLHGHPHFNFHPDFEPSKALKGGSPKPKERISTIDELNDVLEKTDYYLTSGEAISERLTPFTKVSLVQYLRNMPPITSADLIQSSEKVSRLLTINLSDWFVVIEVDDPKTIVDNLTTLGDLASEFNAQSEGSLNLDVLEDWIIIGEEGQHFLISQYIGPTLEQVFKENKVPPGQKEAVLATLRDFASYCEDQRIFWRDLAPRNILVPTEGQNQLIFIDYEHVYKTADLDPFKRKSLDIDRRVWFGDILSQEEIDYLFGKVSEKSTVAGSLLPSNDLERIVYSKSQVSSEEKFALHQKTSFVERVHHYHGKPIYGHRIGRYLTDFVPVEDEAKLYFALEAFDYDTFCRYLLTLQRCINVDSGNALAKMYNQPSVDPATPGFLKEMDDSLSDGQKVLTILEAHESKPI